MPKPFVIYRSSAGSGKTYTLTKEYLKLAFRAPDYFKNILAVTFTNKATKEMKDRVLEVLEELSQGEHPLTYELKEATGLDSNQLQQRATETLKTILHQYSYFSISTIDSFFQKVIRAFAREMGLQGGFHIELDEELVLSEVIDKVLLEVGQNENLTNWLIKFAETRVDDGKPWDTRREIGNLAGEIFQEQFKQFEQQVLQAARDKEFIPRFLGELTRVKQEFEGELKGLGKKGLEIMASYGLEVADFSYKESGAAGYLQKLASGKITAPGIRIQSAAVSNSTWFAKTSPKRAKIVEAADHGLVSTLKEAVDYYKANQVPYESASEVLRYLYTFGILSDLAEKLDEYRDEKEMMLISDAAVFLKKIIADDETPFVYEKIGSRYHHYLIDEFQDTSGFQWDNFKPLVDNSLAEDHFNLIVGDVKQAIYRWRGGDLDLLLQGVEQQFGSARVEYRDLTQNWRSRPNIIDFNNSLFRFARETLHEQVKRKLEEVEAGEVKARLLDHAEKLNVAYGEVIQDNARQFASEDAGLIRLRAFPYYGENGLEWKDNALVQLPGMIEELQDRKYQLRDIAVLVRTRAEGRAVVDHLLHYQSAYGKEGYAYDVISSESLYLENSSITRFLIACIRYIYKPEDIIQRVHMAYEYCQYINPTDQALEELFFAATNIREEQQFQALFPKTFFEALPQLRKMAVYQLTEGLIRTFQLDQFTPERAYLQGFLDAVLDFTKRENDDILSFLTWWEEIGRERTVMVSEDQNAIRVMTIHMAKGLQFKSVIIPFCDWIMDGLQGFDSILWCHDTTPPFDKAPYLPLNYSTKLKSTVFHEDYWDELIRSYLDNLNIMYVAFTRTEEVLLVSMPQHTKKGEIRHASGVIDHYLDSDFKLGGFEVTREEGYTEYRVGNFPGLGVEEIPVDATRQIFLDVFPSHALGARLTIKREFEPEMKHGTTDVIVIKQILKSLTHRRELEKVLDMKLNEGLAHHDHRARLLKELTTLLDKEDIAPWFTRVKQEDVQKTILLGNGDEMDIDRLLKSGDELQCLQIVSMAPGPDEKQLFDRGVRNLEAAGTVAKGFFLDVSTANLIAL